MRYPEAERLDITETIHGHRVRDPYRWLEDPDDPRTKRWLDEQAGLFARWRDVSAPRDAFAARLRRQFAAGMVGLPVVCGDRTFLIERGPDEQHMALRVRDGDGPWRTLVDPNTLDPEHLTTLDGYTPSPDGRFVAYLLSRGGDEASALSVMDAGTGAVVDGPIDRVRWTTIAWLPDAKSFHYQRRTEEGEPHILLHTLGGGDDEVFGTGRARDEELLVSSGPDGAWLVVTATRPPGNATELFLRGPDGSFTALHALDGAETSATPSWDGRVYLLTDLDAPNRRLLAIDPARPDDLIELVPSDPDAVLRGFAVLRDTIVVHRSRDEISELSVHDRVTGGTRGRIATPGQGTAAGPVAPAAGGDRCWFAYGDFLTPQDAYAWRSGDDALTLWRARPGQAVRPEAVVDRVTYRSKDGTEVPMVILRPPGGRTPRPTILYVYGGFGYSVLRPAFDHLAAAWVAAGGQWAIAGLRGGSERGEAWHRAGRREHKQNTFDDCIAAAGWLVAEGYATRDQLGAYGMSNGALTVTVAMNQAPDAFAAVVPTAAGADMLRPIREPQIASPPEYGSPQVPEEFAWIVAYSPYHNVTDGTAYPAVMVNAFGSDVRTPACEGHKLVAMLQHATSSGRPVILRHEADAGHATRSVDKAVDLLADILGFFAGRLGLR